MLCIGSLSLIIAIIFVMVGFNFVRSTNKSTRRLGVVTILLSCSLPFLCCLSFQDLTDPSKLRMKIREGMTEEEVIAAVGEPNVKQTGDWIYRTDLWGLGSVGVHFRDDGRVERTFIND